MEESTAQTTEAVVDLGRGMWSKGWSVLLAVVVSVCLTVGVDQRVRGDDPPRSGRGGGHDRVGRVV